MRIATISALVLVLLSGVAFAGDLATDPNALFYDGDFWCGSTVVDANGIEATVDWCVYGPGVFSYPGLGYTPTPGEFVYAYQLFVEEESSEVLTLSVGLFPGNGANNIGTFAMTGGVEPDWMAIQGTPPYEEAVWEWYPLEPGAHSVGLAYSSLNAPMMYHASVINGGGGASGDVASPSDVIPEPATLGLLLAGAIAGGWRRHRR